MAAAQPAAGGGPAGALAGAQGGRPRAVPAHDRRAPRRLRPRGGQLVTELLARGTVNGVTDIAEAYPLRVFPRAVGITGDCRGQLLAYGNMAFNAFGPHNQLLADSMAEVQGVAAWIAAHCTRDALTPGGLGDRIYASADEGAVTEDEAALLVRSLLTAGVDTTVIGLGCALDCLARDPGQWRRLREDPSLAGAAFEETLRYASPVQTFFRTTTRDVEVGGVRIGEGEKVLLFLAAANRDPRRWPDPERFDITRRAIGHVGLGYGIHACVGAAFARLEGEVLLQALARQVDPWRWRASRAAASTTPSAASRRCRSRSVGDRQACLRAARVSSGARSRSRARHHCWPWAGSR